MITKLVYLRAALYTDRMEAIRATSDLEERRKASAAYVSFVTDTPVMPVFGQARMIWLSPESETLRAFVTAFMGHEPLTYIVCGAACQSSMLAEARQVTAAVLDELRADMKEIAPPLEDDKDALIYVECDDWQGFERPLDAVPTIWTTVVAALQVEGRGYDWKHPAALGNVVGIPAGTLELRYEDIIVGLPHLGETRGLEIPEIIRDFFTLKLLLYSWAPMMEQRVVAQRGGSDFRSVLAARRDWLYSSAKLRATLRAVEASPHVERYLTGVTAVQAPIPQARLEMYFLQHMSARLVEALGSLRERLAFKDDLSNAEMAQVRHEYDFKLAEENVRLQRSVRWLTWVMLIMTAVLLLDSEALRTALTTLIEEIGGLITR